MQKVPRTSPFFEISGCDQAARNPLLKAASRKMAHKGSVAMSVTITRLFRKAAVPQEPTQGPIATGRMAAAQPLGTRPPAAGHSFVPSGSIRRMEEVI